MSDTRLKLAHGNHVPRLGLATYHLSLLLDMGMRWLLHCWRLIHLTVTHLTVTHLQEPRYF